MSLNTPRTATATAVVLGVAGLLLGGCSADVPAAASSSARPTDESVSSAAPSPTSSSSPSVTPSPGGTGAAAAGSGSSGAADEGAQPGKDGSQAAVLARVPGDASGKCVAVGSRRDVRSGSIVGGPFDDAARLWKTQQQNMPTHSVTLYWVPLNAAKMSGVTVKATNRTTGTSQTVTSTSVSDAEQWKYYSTRLVLRDAGTWRFSVSSGGDAGCFDLVVK